uniref:[histone H3]-lysine(4) N-trimethyltransferase n=1 Tax=Sinocyclocheilus anshuiensis TaxID=1608454 RepID=A0A671PSA3_9TELE
MSSRKDDDNLLRMTKDDLQRWIQAEVDRNPHLMQRREQLAQVEDWVKQKEREATYTHLLYSNACESVHECESVMKGLYGMLGLEYRDEDSEEEGGGGREPQDVIHITDDEEDKQENSVLNGDDDDIVVIDLGATKETLEPMLEKVTVAIQKSSRLVQDLVQMVNKTSSMSAASPSSSSDVSNRPSSASTFETSRSESVTPKLEVPENPIAKVKTESLPKVPEMPSLLSNSEQYKPIAGYKSDSKPTIKTEPQLTALTPWEMSISKQHETSATLNSPSLKLIKTEPQLTAVSPSETPETFASPHFGSIATIKTEPQSTVIKSEMTSPPSTSKPFKIASIASIKTEPQLRALTPEMSLLERDSEKSSSLRSDHEATSNTERTLPAMTYEILKTSACPYSASVASKKTDPQVPLVTPSEMSSPSSSSKQMETAASENTANVETNQTEPESTTETPPELASLLSNSEEAETNASHDSDSTDETEQPKPRSKSDKPSVTETSPTTRLRSSKNNAPVSSTSSPQTEATRGQTPADSNDELSDTEDLSVSPADSDYEPPDSSDASAEPSSYKSSSSESSKQQEHKEIKLKVGMVVLGKRAHNLWRKGTVQEVQTEEDGLRYKVESKSGKEIVLPAYQVASLQPPILKDLFIGCRVVASSIDDEGKASFNAAVLVELPERKNRMRFLVFFDDGHAAYLALPDLHIVCKQLKKVWKDIEDEKLQLQVKEYLRVYPNPIAVVLRAGQDTKAIRNGKFETCTVLQLDGSLIQICFKKDKQKEWIYKGSDRLEHIVNIKQRLAKDKPQKKPLQKTQHKPQQPTTPSSTAVPSATVTSTTVTATAVSPVRVTRQSDTVIKTSSVSPQNIMSAAFQPKVILQRLTMLSPVVRAVSNLRSAKRPASDEEEECVSEEEDCVSMQHQYKSIYLHHRCCPACLDGLRPSQVNMHQGQNPLLVPLLFKFRRMTARRRIDGKVFFHIFYRSPCGRSLCDMQEVQEYLLETRCDFLFLEMFCMDPFVLVNRSRPPSTSTGKPHLYLPDISEGREVLPVPCINEVDNTLAPNISYTKDRVPAPGVSVNTSPDFLIGCDCTDGCQDRSKCACHQLTVEATSLCSGGPVDISAGYTHKRLPTTLPTGVYECNPLCRCDPRMCSNRLVQHGLQLRLELFMTQHKGWGIRCRDDVAKGTFVCVFTGKIVNEDRMNEDDTVSGNEYLANLDFIEGVEKLKEGYESEAYCSDTEVETNKKTIKMKTGPLWKNTLCQEDSSSGEELMELDTEQEETEVNHMSFGERKLSHKPHETYKDAQKKVTKQMREDGEETSGPKRCFAIKSFQRRVKPLETLDAKNEKTRTAVTGKNTRRLFNSEETCYIIDARQQGNLGRFINHSCSPNLFVQNVFVDTHDLRFPWVAFFASKRIKAGTELTWDYNYEVGSVEGKVLLCCCGSLRCTGRLL